MIVSEDFTDVSAFGYNGPAVGQSNDACSGVPGACGCIHAEANALARSRGLGMLLCTTSPCAHCAGLIANSRRVTRVIYQYVYRDPEPGLAILKAANIQVEQYDPHWE